MDLYTFLIQNKETFKLIYALVIVLICVFIVAKTHKLFKLSSHNGIRYFRNAFFFYGIGFFIRYFLGYFEIFSPLDYYSSFVQIFFEFFIIMGGFMLLYSMLWKKFESGPIKSSIFNARISIFYALAITMSLLDFAISFLYFLFFSQIITFFFASIISHLNYKRSETKSPFLKFYFIAMLLALFAWALNAIAGLYFHWDRSLIINTYLLNSIFFLFFLYGVLKSEK